MGGAQSSELKRSDELLGRLAGPEKLEHQDVFWKELFLAFSMPLASLDPVLVEAKLEPYCKSLLVYNPGTHNFQSLVLHAVTLLHDVRAGKNRRAASNALRFIGAVVKSVVEGAGDPASALGALFEITPSLPIPRELVSVGSHQLLKILARRLFATLAETEPSSPATYVLLMEVAQLLLLLASSQLSSTRVHAPMGTHPGLDVFHLQQHHAPQVTTRLLKLLVSRPPPPTDGTLFLGRAAQESALYRAAKTTASTLFWLPAATLSFVASSVVGSGGGQWPLPLSSSPLGDLALLLLLVLVHNPDSPPSSINSFRWALHALVDADDSAQGDVEGGGSGVSSTTSYNAFIKFSSLFDALAAGLSAPVAPPHSGAGPSSGAAGSSSTGADAASSSSVSGSGGAGGTVPPSGTVTSGAEEAAILAYSLLHGSSAFRDYVLSRTDVEVLLVPLLRHMYNMAAKDHPSFMYMLQVLVLLLSQDTSFAANVHRVPLPGGAPWYKEQLLSGARGSAADGASAATASGPDGAAAAVAGGAAPAPGGLTLGSLLVIVCLRTVSANFGGAGSGPGSELQLPTNALAALANLAPHMSHLHPHAAQRLVGLLGALAKRYSRVNARLEAATTGAPPPAFAVAAAGGEGHQHHQLSQDPQVIAGELAVLEDYLRIVLEILNAALLGSQGAGTTPAASAHTSYSGAGAIVGGGPGQAGSGAASVGVQLARNAELVYALLHRQEVVTSLQGIPRLSDLVSNLQALVSFFNQRLDDARISEGGGGAASRSNSSSLTHSASGPGLPTLSPSAAAVAGGAGGSWSVGKVLSLVASSAYYFRPDRLCHAFPELRFVYEEEGDAAAFFVPYVWTLVVQRCGSIPWDLAKISLFRPRQLGPAPRDSGSLDGQ